MKNSDTIREMIHGEKGKIENVKMSEEYSKLLQSFIDVDKEMKEKLKNSPEMLEKYNKAIDAFWAYSSEESTCFYIEGFRFGVLLGLEIAN